MNPKISISKSGPGLRDIEKALRRLSRVDVLVGIPQQENARRGEPIGNAALLYIHTNGSPAHGIPPRPVIEPAIEAADNKKIITDELADAASAQMRGRTDLVAEHLERAGIAGMNASKEWFTDARNNWAPNAPSTIRRKHSDRPLIDTGTLRRALTYVVRGESTESTGNTARTNESPAREAEEVVEEVVEEALGE